MVAVAGQRGFELRAIALGDDRARRLVREEIVGRLLRLLSGDVGGGQQRRKVVAVVLLQEQFELVEEQRDAVRRSGWSRCLLGRCRVVLRREGGCGRCAQQERQREREADDRKSHAVAHREMEPLIVIAARVVVRTEIEHRNRCEAAVAAELQPALLPPEDGTGIADNAIRDIVEILVVAADEFVQV